MTDLEIPVLGERQKSALSMAGVFLGQVKPKLEKHECRTVAKCWDEPDAEELARQKHPRHENRGRPSNVPRKLQDVIRAEYAKGVALRQKAAKFTLQGIAQRHKMAKGTIWYVIHGK